MRKLVVTHIVFTVVSRPCMSSFELSLDCPDFFRTAGVLHRPDTTTEVPACIVNSVAETTCSLLD